MLPSVDVLRDYFEYDPETGVVRYKQQTSTRTPVGTVAGSGNSEGYLQVEFLGRKLKLHRIIWLLMTGEWPVADIDHIDRDKRNNKWSNLRAASRAQNNWNASRRPGKTGVLGVKVIDRTIYAQIRHNGKRIYLGSFASIEEASAAREMAAQALRGDFYLKDKT